MFTVIVSRIRIAILLVAGLHSLSAIQIVNFDALTNDRFANDSSFIASQFDLSGVAHNGRWATMISENVYITANHFSPGVGSSMTFYAGNDPSGFSVTREITSNRQRIGDTDIFVGTLDAALPSSFTFYNFATETINTGPGGGPNSFQNSPYANAEAYAFGRSPTSFPASQNMAVGRNVLDNFASRTAAGATGASIEATFDGPDGVEFEAMLETGDSGAPLFVENGEGGLTIVGVNWFVGTSGADEIFGAAYLGNYSDDIQAFIDANVIPEPATVLLLLSALSGLVAVRRRSRQGV